MPASGKSTIGELLATRLDRSFVDTDKLIEEKTGMSIPDIFKKFGEAHFRNVETEVIKEASLSLRGAVISTGGGAVLKEENTKALRQNGRLYFIDRPLSMLVPTSDRPLSSTVEDITKRYNERFPIYVKTADVRSDNSETPEKAVDAVIRDFFEERVI